MRDFITSIAGAIIFFGILYLPLDGELKNLLVALFCALILAAYVTRAAISQDDMAWGPVATISLPTIIFLGAAALNYVLQLGIGGIYFWIPYAIFTALALHLASGPETPRDLSKRCRPRTGYRRHCFCKPPC